MLKEFKRQLFVGRVTYLTGIIWVLAIPLALTAGFAIGTAASGFDELPAVGNLVLVSTAALFGFIFSLTTTSVQLNMALKMGATRRRYMLASITCQFLFSFLLMLLAYLYLPLEQRLLYAAGSRADFALSIPVGTLALVAFAAVLVGTWCGGLMMRYGRRGFWLVYGVLLVVMLGGGQVGHLYTSETTTGLAGMVKVVGGFLVRLPISGLWLLAAAALLALGLHTYLMLRRVAVQN